MGEKERDSMAEKGNTSRKTCLPWIVITPLLEGASRKTSNKHSHANTRQAHTTSITGSLWAAPQLLPGLSGIPLQCTSLSLLSPIFPLRGEQWGRCRCCGWVTVQVGDSRQLAAASAAGLWLLPELLLLLLLLMMPRRRRAEWGGGGCWRWCCCYGYLTQWQRRHCSAQQLPQHPGLLSTHHGQTPLEVQARGISPQSPSRGTVTVGRMEVTPWCSTGALGKQMEWCIRNVYILHLWVRISLPGKGQTPASRRPEFCFSGMPCIFIRKWTKQQSWGGE